MHDISLKATLPEKSFFIVLLLGFVAAELLVILASLAFPLEVLLAIVGMGVLAFIFKNTFISLCTLILSHYFVLRGTEQITLPEIFFGLYFCAFLGVWFFRKIFLERQKILIDKLDYALAGFLGFCVLSLIPAVLVGSSLLKWLRELVPFLTLLFFFPILHEVNSPKRIKIIVACFLLLGLAVAVENVFSYKQAITKVLYFWEITSSRRAANEPLFMASFITASTFFVLAKTTTGRWFALGLATFFGITLAITFSRGYWVAGALGLMALFWFAPREYKLRMVIYFSSVLLLALGVAFLFFGEIATFFIDALGQRFQTVGGAVQDLSFANRLVEAQAVLAQIKDNPIVGYGLGRTYSYEALIPIEHPTWYVHNTVLFIWYKVGVVGLICLLVFIGGIFIRCLHAYKVETNRFVKTLLIALLACLLSLIFVSFSSPQLLEKNSSLLVALICGMVQAAWRQQSQVNQ